jgi:hypothetical protein
MVIAPIAVTDNQKPKGTTQAKDNKAVFIVGMVRVTDQQSTLVHEDGLGLIKTDAVLLHILSGF